MNIENNMMKKLILYKYYSKERWYSYVNIRQNQDEEHLQGHIGNKRTSDSNKKKIPPSRYDNPELLCSQQYNKNGKNHKEK